MALAAGSPATSAGAAPIAGDPSGDGAVTADRVPLLTSVWSSNRWVLSTIVLSVAASAIVGPLVGWAGTSEWRSAYMTYAVVPAVLAILAVPVRLFLHRQRAPSNMAVAAAWRWAWRTARRRELAGDRLVAAVLIVALLPVFGIVFTAWKATIPLVQPFQWDVALAAADRALHGGMDAWRMLGPIYEHPGLVRAIDTAYVLWFVPTMIVPPLVAWAPFSVLRERFLLTFLLSWLVLGIGVAMMFSSAGPCYFHWATGIPLAEDPFHPLLQHLWGNLDPAPLRAVKIQAVLVGAQSDPSQVGRGISAFPSLHVGVTVLYALAGWHISRVLGLLATLFALTTLLGSVVLGWHYAVDGYAGAIGVALIWWLSGKLVSRTAPAS